MPKYIVRNNGPLFGEVNISGSKNAVLPLMAASILTKEKCEIRCTPALRDVDVMCEIIQAIGGSVDFDKESNCVVLETGNITHTGAQYELASRMRASILVMGPLLARTGRATIALPGGCAIGARPIDLHLKGFEAMGVKITDKFVSGFNYIEAKADKIAGCDIFLDFPSVGATENLMTLAVLTEGVTTIQNAAQEPEIVDLANFLNKMGAKVKGAGTDTIKIEGVKELHGTTHTVIPDRIETGTFMIAAAISKGKIKVNNAVADHVKPISAKLRECGAVVTEEDDAIIVDAQDKNLISTNIKTLPYPGFPTDLQSPFMSLLAVTEGMSTVIETVFENRFMHVAELKKMGADVNHEERKAEITGVNKLNGAVVQATDLRAGAALVLAGLVAEGTTEVNQVYYVERGYEKFVEKLSSVGADIEYME